MSFFDDCAEEVDLIIDHLLLDRQWAEQPNLVFIWGERLAKERLNLDRAKDKLARQQAELAKKIRLRPHQYKLDKITDQNVMMTVTLQPDYIKAQKRVNNYQYKVNVLRGMMDALDNRKEALKGSVFLRSQQWFSEPQASPQGREELKKTAERRRRRKNRKS